MFLLITGKEDGPLHGTNFNTSHVSINLSCAMYARLLKGNFNTSHVSINPFLASLRT